MLPDAWGNGKAFPKLLNLYLSGNDLGDLDSPGGLPLTWTSVKVPRSFPALQKMMLYPGNDFLCTWGNGQTQYSELLSDSVGSLPSERHKFEMAEREASGGGNLPAWRLRAGGSREQLSYRRLLVFSTLPHISLGYPPDPGSTVRELASKVQAGLRAGPYTWLARHSPLLPQPLAYVSHLPAVPHCLVLRRQLECLSVQRAAFSESDLLLALPTCPPAEARFSVVDDSGVEYGQAAGNMQLCPEPADDNPPTSPSLTKPASVLGLSWKAPATYAGFFCGFQASLTSGSSTLLPATNYVMRPEQQAPLAYDSATKTYSVATALVPATGATYTMHVSTLYCDGYTSSEVTDDLAL